MVCLRCLGDARIVTECTSSCDWSTLILVRKLLNHRFLSSSTVQVKLISTTMPMAFARNAFNGDVQAATRCTMRAKSGAIFRLLWSTRTTRLSMPAMQLAVPWQADRSGGPVC